MRLHTFVVWGLVLATGGLGTGCAGNKSAPNPYAAQPPSSWSKFTAAVSKPFKSDPAVASTPPADANDPTSVFAKPKQFDANFYVSVAAVQERGNNAKAAAASYEKALKQDAKHVPALMGYARLMDRQNSFTEATALYQRADQAQPKDAAICNDWGLCLARQGHAEQSPQRLQQAAQRLEQAVKLQPDKKLYRNNLATVLVDIGRPQEAYAHLAAVHPADVAHYNVGYLLSQTNQPQAAAEQFALALQKNPQLAEARQWLNAINQQQAIAAAQSAPRVEQPLEVKPVAASPQDRVANRYDDRYEDRYEAQPQPEARARQPLVTPSQVQPLVKQPRPLQVGERYSSPPADYDRPVTPLPPVIDYEALPGTDEGETDAPTPDAASTGGGRPYQARNSGWKSELPAR
ncbi:MAG: tetratricopeptide repeat protein [Pirellulales bacterium]